MFDSIELNRILLVSSKIILLNVDGLYFSVHVVEFIIYSLYLKIMFK